MKSAHGNISYWGELESDEESEGEDGDQDMDTDDESDEDQAAASAMAENEAKKMLVTLPSAGSIPRPVDVGGLVTPAGG